MFDVELLARRLSSATRWLRGRQVGGDLPIGYFGASTGAAAALWAAAGLKGEVSAVVSRGGRPDLAGPCLADVEAPTLFIVGGRDQVVLPGATHLFEEPGAMEAVAVLARDWFTRYL